MAETKLLRVLSAYFGFPIILTVAFVLLLFWICRYFGSNALNQAQNRGAPAQPPVPIRNLNLRNLTATMIMLLLVPLGFSDTSELPSDCDPKAITKNLKRFQTAVKTCKLENLGLSDIRKAMCDPLFYPEDASDTTEWLSNKYQLALGTSCLALIILIVIIIFKKRRQTQLGNLAPVQPARN